MKKEDVLKYFVERKPYFQKNYFISDIFLFGSIVKRDNTKINDIDIAIKTPLCDYFKLYDLKEELEKAFGKPVDIVRIRKKMNESLKRRILSEGYRI